MNWKRLHLYLFTFCRYFIATMLISYAFSKIFETQFISQPSVYDKPIGSLNGFQLTWYYYGYSYWYGVMIAITQIISALFLFFRRTTRIGVIMFLAFMVNILLVDFAYDIQGAKGMATLLTLMGLFILLSDYKVLVKFFITEPPLFQDQERPSWMNKIVKLKFIYIPVVFIGIFFLINTLKNKYMGRNDFYGSWENSKTAERIHFEAANTFQLNKEPDFKPFIHGKYSFTPDTITLNTASEATDKDVKNTFLQGKYKLDKNNLTIINASDTLHFKRIR